MARQVQQQPIDLSVLYKDMGRTDEKLKAAVYTRISNDPEGRALGVERQEQDCRNLAKNHGFEVVEVYTDNDISASRSSKKRRPGFEAMPGAAASGQFDAVLFYATSRLTRPPRRVRAADPAPRSMDECPIR